MYYVMAATMSDPVSLRDAAIALHDGGCVINATECILIVLRADSELDARGKVRSMLASVGFSQFCSTVEVVSVHKRSDSREIRRRKDDAKQFWIEFQLGIGLAGKIREASDWLYGGMFKPSNRSAEGVAD